MTATSREGARARVQASLERIDATDGVVNAFSAVLSDRALARADALDAMPAAQRAALPLFGMPFAAKNLFDIEGMVTLAGSIIERDAAPAARDAFLVRRLEAAGAILVGATHMDEYAYGFTTENSHYGPTRNPHDPQRSAGGSSGGSAASVAAGQVPLALGSDTNGSIRVPASFCGVHGFKPTFGRLARTGSYPFVASLDHLGPFARTVPQLVAAYDALLGLDPADPAQASRDPTPVAAALGKGLDGLRLGVLGGWFRDMAEAPATAAVDRVAAVLGAAREILWPEVGRARTAAFLVTFAEGAALHLPDLRRRAQDFEPLTRDRLLSGALAPAAWLQQAQRLRRWFAREVALCFADVDVVIAPATPFTARRLGTDWIDIGGQRMPARSAMGLMTQPISCIGLPSVSVPLWGMDPQAPHLPIGVQLIAPPWREDLCLRVAAVLESAGLARVPIAAIDP